MNNNRESLLLFIYINYNYFQNPGSINHVPCICIVLYNNSVKSTVLLNVVNKNIKSFPSIHSGLESFLKSENSLN